MKRYTQTFQYPESTNDLSVMIDGEVHNPTREEFYTNYPFFKYWNKENNEKLSKPDGINIYIHIPFCIQICDYCFYMKELIKSKDQVDTYVDNLCKEIELVSSVYSLSNRNIDAIYFGGGTPSVLTKQQLDKIINALHKHHNFVPTEFSFEAEPGTFSKSKLEMYKSVGVNRISMGVQSFVDEIIELSSRKHTGEQAIKSIETVKEVGGFELNIDLLSGLAGEDMHSWQRSLEISIEQDIDMLTIYKMKNYSNTNFFMKSVHNKELQLPNEKEEIAFMDVAFDTLLSSGFDMWSTFAFNRNNTKVTYIENSWRGKDMIAYGASSFGKIGNINYQNLNNINLYSERIGKGQLPVYRTYAMSYKDMIVKELLLCSRLFSYTKDEFVEKFGFDYFNFIPETIDQLQLKGYIHDNTDELVLTKRGVLFADFVAKVLSSSVKDKLKKDKINFVY